MRRLTLLLSALLLLRSMAPTLSQAQSWDNDDTRHYSRFNVGVAASRAFQVEGDPVSKQMLSGWQVSCLRGINITGHSHPLFLEVGPEVTSLSRSEQIDEWDYDQLISSTEQVTRRLTISTPIDLSYHLRLDDHLVVAPSAGLNAQYILRHKRTGGDSTLDYFDQGARRFVLGCNLGCALIAGHWLLNACYTRDLTPATSLHGNQSGHHTLSFSIGLQF